MIKLSNVFRASLQVLGFLVATNSMAQYSAPYQNTKICGPDEAYCADVFLEDDIRRAQVTAKVVPDDKGERVFGYLKNTLAIPISDMRQDCDAGSYTTAKCDFAITPDATHDTLIQAVRCFAGCGTIKYGQYICENSSLTNGIELTIRSNGILSALPLIKLTEDWKNLFSFPDPGSAFVLNKQAGDDQLTAQMGLDVPIILKKIGTFPGNEDYVKMKVQDNLSGAAGGNLTQHQCFAFGFRSE